MSTKTDSHIQTALGVIVIALAMAGLHADVDYSGWVLVIGILMVI